MTNRGCMAWHPKALRAASFSSLSLQERFQQVAVGMMGFVWRAERPDAATFVDQKWGYSANGTGGQPHPWALTMQPRLSCMPCSGFGAGWQLFCMARQARSPPHVPALHATTCAAPVPCPQATGSSWKAAPWTAPARLAAARQPPSSLATSAAMKGWGQRGCSAWRAAPAQRAASRGSGRSACRSPKCTSCRCAAGPAPAAAAASCRQLLPPLQACYPGGGSLFPPCLSMGPAGFAAPQVSHTGDACAAEGWPERRRRRRQGAAQCLDGVACPAGARFADSRGGRRAGRPRLSAQPLAMLVAAAPLCWKGLVTR